MTADILIGRCICRKLSTSTTTLNHQPNQCIVRPTSKYNMLMTADTLIGTCIDSKHSMNSSFSATLNRLIRITIVLEQCELDIRMLA